MLMLILLSLVVVVVVVVGSCLLVVLVLIDFCLTLQLSFSVVLSGNNLFHRLLDSS